MTAMSAANHHALTETERDQLKTLRAHRRRKRSHPPTAGQKVADAVAATMGSWPFIIVQTSILAAWIVLNVTAWVQAWDPYPFILLNLALSFQAAYAAPFIMMSQNRQSEIDRARAIDDYDVNCKAELEIELLHQKLDMLREQEIMRLIKVVEELTVKLQPATPQP
jgi:uncharacterized membrane protein